MTLGAVAVLASVLAVSCAGVVLLTEQALTADLDQAAALRARDVASLLPAGRLGTTVPGAGEESSFVQVIGPADQVVSASANVTGQGPVIPAPKDARQVTVTLDSSPLGSEPLRIVAVPVHLPSGPGWIYVGTSLVQLRTTMSTLILLFTTGLPLLMLIVAWTVWRTLGRALRPMEAIRAEASQIGHSDLARRVPVPPHNDEVGRLATTMNAMLDRLEASSRRQEQFIGDASHELRSPLTALRTQVGVALAHPDPEHTRDLLATIDQQTQRMAALIDSMLYLARTNRSPPGSLTDVDLDDLVLEEARRLRSIGGLRIHTAALAAARVRGSTVDLSRMLRNLGDNAHNHADSTITVALTTDNTTAELRIADDGSGIPPGDRERVFERFTRLDQARARSSSGGGTGLGLAIAQQIAHAHAGTITIDDGDRCRGAVFIIRLPLSAHHGP
ncbi:MAG: sensor histidine kinase [Leifsonia sp.]|uniref:sensor histidine kinase n=1 Tax=Leifsonia sp. TaxID=1870902 RepID=UPI003F7ECD2A